MIELSSRQGVMSSSSVEKPELEQYPVVPAGHKIYST